MALAGPSTFSGSGASIETSESHRSTRARLSSGGLFALYGARGFSLSAPTIQSSCVFMFVSRLRKRGIRAPFGYYSVPLGAPEAT